MTLQYKTSEKSGQFLEPVGSGLVDVINDFQWTLSPKDARIDVPTIYLTEYQQNVGQLISSIIYYSKVTQSISTGESGFITGPKDPSEIYRYKYFAIPTGFKYRFPYFSSAHTSRTSDFGYEDGQSPFNGLMNLGTSIAQYGGYRGGLLPGRNFIGEVFGVIPNVASAVGGALNSLLPGKLTLENPQSWTGTEESTYSVTFDLFNTGTIDDVKNNRNLCHILRTQQSPFRRNFAITDPVCIYDVFIPDICHLPAACMTNLEISNLGNTRQVELDGSTKRIIPEAYRIKMTFESLFMPSRNIMGGIDTGKLVSAIEDSTAATEYIKGLSSFSDDNSMQNYERVRELGNNVADQYGIDRNNLQNITNAKFEGTAT